MSAPSVHPVDEDEAAQPRADAKWAREVQQLLLDQHRAVVRYHRHHRWHTHTHHSYNSLSPCQAEQALILLSVVSIIRINWAISILDAYSIYVIILSLPLLYWKCETWMYTKIVYICVKNYIHILINVSSVNYTVSMLMLTWHWYESLEHITRQILILEISHLTNWAEENRL